MVLILGRTRTRLDERSSLFGVWLFLLSAIVLLSFPAMASQGKDHQVLSEQALWQRLAKGGHFALLRHALAPGTGDPKGFMLDDCSTQRNLSEEGRKQALILATRFRQYGIESGRVYSSEWCRCMDTAVLLNLGEVHALPALNSFFEQPEYRDDQTRQFEAWLAQQSFAKPMVFVTHQVNITALTGIYPASGEMLVMQVLGPGDFKLLGRIRSD